MIPKRIHTNYRNLAFATLAALLMLTLFMAPATHAAPLSNGGHNYIVQYGDTLSEIAQMHGISTAQLMHANALSNADHIHSGDILYIPSRSSHYRQSCRYYHQVSYGQSLSWISVYYGIEMSSLAQANGIYNYDKVKIGQSLCIPAYGGASRVQAPAPRTSYRTIQHHVPAPPPPPTATPTPYPTQNPLHYYPEPNGYAYYTLVVGDTLSSLAAYYQTTEHHISVLNPGAIITPGTTLLVPLYHGVPMPPTATPLYYPIVFTPAPTKTSTPTFTSTSTPRPPIATPRPATPSAPVVNVEINIVNQEGFSVDVSPPGAVTVITSVPTATPNRSSGSNSMPPTAIPPSATPTTRPMAGPTPTPTAIPPTPTPDFDGPISPFTGQFFPVPNFQGQPLYTNSNKTINFDWGNGGPGYGLPDDNYSIRWTTHEKFDAGRYTFRAYVEGGIRIYVDEVLLIDKWQDSTGNYLAEIDLAEGHHTIQVYYGKLGPTAHIRVWWTKNK